MVSRRKRAPRAILRAGRTPAKLADGADGGGVPRRPQTCKDERPCNDARAKHGRRKASMTTRDAADRAPRASADCRAPVMLT
ncbi:hypothetical protein GCM10027093_65520 [Paraburkholderia jirisanensis]